MSDIKFEILYQSKTIFVIINKDENDNNLFKKFIEQLKKELNIIDTDKKTIFKIMTLNTKELYLIVNEDNFSNIIKEEKNNDIIKLFVDIEFMEEKNEIKNKNKIIEEDDDFNEEISLSIFDKKNKINSDEKIDKKIIIEERSNNIINKENQEKNINNNIINEDNHILLKKENINSQLNQNQNIMNEINIIDSRKDIINKNKNNPNLNLIEIEKENNNINQININDLNNQREIYEQCKICDKLIKEKIKYECCICDKCILCENCEKNHEHPCIKFKKKNFFLNSLKSCHFFISQKHNINSLLSFKQIKNIFSNATYDLIIQLDIDDHIEFSPNTLIEIPFKIKNFSDFPINSEDFIIISRNFSIVNITYDIKDKFIIQPKNFINKKLLCQSYNKKGREIINVEIYSNKIKIRENKNIRENIEIVISDDEENKELNKKFIFFPKIQLLNKLRKKMLLYILDNHFVEKSVTQIYESLKNNKWDLDAALNELKNLDM